MKNRRKLTLTITAVSCAVIVGIFGLMASAEAAGSVSMGDIVADDGQVAFYGSDVTYLNREIGSLRSEIDYSVFGNAAADGNVSLLTDRWRDPLSSHGIINYDNGKVVVSAADVINLADGIDALGNDYAAMVCRALNMIGTFFDTGGNINHESQTTASVILSCEQLAAGILKSQSVDHLSAEPVTEENITAGAAAWVNGRCIIGNGADNERAYKRGIEDGEKGDGDGIEMEPTYHAHAGNGESGWSDETVFYQTENPGGCYVGNEHTHNKTGSCSKRLEECQGYCNFSMGCWHNDESFMSQSGEGCWICQFCGKHRRGWSGSADRDGHTSCDNTVTVYTCGSPDNTWKIGCGKKAGDLESVTVIVHKNHETRK